MKGAVKIQAVLYVAHGSRSKEGILEAKKFIKYHMKRVNAPIQIISFIDLAPPSIETGINECIRQGASKIAIIPILLLEAGHAKYDIPLAIQKGKKMFPHITFTYSRPFGVQESIVDILIKRMKEKDEILQDARILIVARGSSDNSIRNDFKQIITLMKNKLSVSAINVCYLAAQNPSFSEGLKKEIESNANRIFIVPYLLFTGLLMLRIKNTIKKINDTDKQFILCDQIGLDKHLSKLLIKKINECIK